MTNTEFSTEFDVLYNNIMSNAAPGLNNYEKSIFLTKALEEIIIELYNGKNILNDSFEKTEEVRRYLNELVKTYETSTKLSGKIGLSPNSVFFSLPEDMWFITYESVTLQDDSLKCNNILALVTPITQDEYYNINNNPFRGASKRRVLRLDIENNCAELISIYNINKYLIRYIEKPSPIILEDFDRYSTIGGSHEETPCKLNTAVHRAILDRAVNLAKAAYKQ